LDWIGVEVNVNCGFDAVDEREKTVEIEEAYIGSWTMIFLNWVFTVDVCFIVCLFGVVEFRLHRVNAQILVRVPRVY
jgi:hypothetical protein